MQPEFQCQKCEESFGVDISDLSSDPTLRCPSCGAHAPVEINSEELPPPYDEAPAVARKAALLDEEESEDEDESEDEESTERDLDF
jgi:DNA-directed RNA polymerase subunit RPC12/RpoP